MTNALRAETGENGPIDVPGLGHEPARQPRPTSSPSSSTSSGPHPRSPARLTAPAPSMTGAVAGWASVSHPVGDVPANWTPCGKVCLVGWGAVVIGLLAGAVAGLAFGRWGRGGRRRGQGARSWTGIGSDSFDRRLVDLDRRLYLGLDSVQDAQARAADTAAQVRERVAVVAGWPSRSSSRPAG